MPINYFTKITNIDLGGGIVLADARPSMPRNRLHGAPYKARDKPPVWEFHHHSGADGKPGLLGARNSATYDVLNRGFPGAAYTFWIPSADDENLVYQLNDVDTISWHTGGLANRRGIGVCWQGNLDHKPPTEFQCVAAAALRTFIDAHWPITKVSTHALSKPFGGTGKAACPGPFVTEWLKDHCPKFAERP